jgi:ASCH domain-containing protein
MIYQRTGLALSVQQPWAWLIVNGFKPVENRDWSTKVRGVIGIHAGKKIDEDAFDWLAQAFPLITLPQSFDTGGIVGRVTLIDCVTEHPSGFFFGEYGFVFQSAEPLPLMPCRGQLGFFRPMFPAPRGAP